MEDAAQLTLQIAELRYALDTFYFLVMGALVMWMAAGFTMLESGLVRARNTAEILTKNVGLLSIFSWVFVTSLLVWFAIKLAIGIRVDQEHEYEGVDISECGLEAYPEFTNAE